MVHQYERNNRTTEGKHMPIKLLILIILNHVITSILHAETQQKYPEFHGPYLGQKVPGKVAEPFAPGIISTDLWELEGVFSPDMKEFFYTIDRGVYEGENKTGFRPTVIGFRQHNNVWTKFTEFPRTGEISFSPDGKRMHMAKGFKSRANGEWSDTVSLGPLFDRKDWGIMRLSSSLTQTYVFDDYNGDIIRLSELKHGVRQPPQLMNKELKSGKWTAHPFITPDESYLIWDSERDDWYRETDLYISFKQTDGSWGKAINMGPNINSVENDFFASVTADGKYILFNRKIGGDNIDIYWVSADIIQSLRDIEMTH